MKALLRMFCWMVLAALAAGPAFAAALGTGFTYQGQLILSGSPVTGNVTLRFSLWDAVSGGTEIGAREIVAGTSVTNGQFVVQLNDASVPYPNGLFGASAFNGDARWLQIEICSDVSCSGAPTVLAPRQPVTAAPYSRFAAGPWQLNGGSLYYTGGNVGIGTTTPHAPLELLSGFGTEVLRFGLDDSDYHFLSTGFHGAQPFLNFLGFNIEHGSNDVRRVLTLQGDGNVGIGTTTPQSSLDVRGDVRLGPSGELRATGGEENLKIIRGGVNSNGTIMTGAGFTPTRYGIPHCCKKIWAQRDVRN
jgi:hypothetical protein